MNDRILKILICPISRDVMADPVTDDNGYTFERSAIEKEFQIQKENKRQPHTPGVGKPLKNWELRPNWSLRPFVDRYLSRTDEGKAAIERRNHYYREKIRQEEEAARIAHMSLLSLGVSEAELSKLSAAKVAILEIYLRQIKSILNETQVSWDDLIETDDLVLIKILPFFVYPIDLLKAGVSWNELTQTNLDLLEKILPLSEKLSTLLESGISWNQLTQTNLDVLEKILAKSADSKILLKTGISWNQLTQTNLDLLEKTLTKSADSRILLKTGISWNQLTQTNPDALEKILPFSEKLRTLLDSGISWNDLIQHADQLNKLFKKLFYAYPLVDLWKESGLSFTKLMQFPTGQLLVLVSDQSDTKTLIKKTGLSWEKLINLPEEQRKFLFDSTDNILNWLKKYPMPSILFFTEHQDLVDGFIKNSDHVDQWIQHNPSYKIHDLLQTFLEIHIGRKAQGERVDFSNQLPTYFSCFIQQKQREHEMQQCQIEVSKAKEQQSEQQTAQEREVKDHETERQSIFTHFCEGLPTPWCNLPYEEAIDNYLKYFFPDPIERNAFKESVIFPLAKKDKELHLRHNLASHFNVIRLTIDKNPEDLIILEKLADILIASFTDQCIPEDYLSILRDSFLMQWITYRYMTNITLNLISVIALFTQCYIDIQLNDIEKEDKKLCSLRLKWKLAKNKKNIQQELQIRWYKLLLEQNSLKYSGTFFYTLQQQLETIKAKIDKNFIYSTEFLCDGWFQKLCVFLNILGFILFPLVAVTLLYAHFKNPEKYPLFIVPKTPFITKAEEKRDKISYFQTWLTNIFTKRNCELNTNIDNTFLTVLPNQILLTDNQDEYKTKIIR